MVRKQGADELKGFCFDGLNFLKFLDKVLAFLGSELLIFVTIVMHKALQDTFVMSCWCAVIYQNQVSVRKTMIKRNTILFCLGILPIEGILGIGSLVFPFGHHAAHVVLRLDTYKAPI